jgi:hypothetical protein
MSSGLDQYGDLLVFEESLRKEYLRLIQLKRTYTCMPSSLSSRDLVN